MTRAASLALFLLLEVALLLAAFTVAAAVCVGVGMAVQRPDLSALTSGEAGAPPPELMAFLVLALSVALQGVLLVYPVVRERAKLPAWLRLDGPTLAWGLGGGLLLLTTGVGYELALRGLGIETPDFARMLFTLMPPWAVYLLAVVLAPVGEELYFRGRLFDGIGERVGLPAAVVGTSVAFALLHAVPELIPVYVTFGMVLAGLRLRTGGLAAPILAHLLNNLVGIVAVRLNGPV
jgi:membrane protease YdiL (CAAX protease family)